MKNRLMQSSDICGTRKICCNKIIGSVVFLITVVCGNPRNGLLDSQDSPTNVCYIELFKEPYDCPDNYDQNISKNGDYLECEGKNYTFADIQSRLTNGETRINECKDTKKKKINCCLLSFMGNKADKCLDSEQYACYRGDTVDTYTARCVPPKVKMDCKCYQSQFPLCVEDNLTSCNYYTDNECRNQTETDDGAQLRCICNKTRGDTPKLTQCSKLSEANLCKHRISQDSSNTKCFIEVRSSKEQRDCSQVSHNNIYQHIFNDSGTAYLKCGGKNYTFKDIQDWFEKKDGVIKDCDDNTIKRKINCCVLSYMGNIMNICNNSGQYGCYIDDTAKDYTLTTPQCKPYFVKLGCKCNQSQIPVCLPSCESYMDVAKCHQTVTADKTHLSCICNTTLDAGKNLQKCTTETNYGCTTQASCTIGVNYSISLGFVLCAIGYLWKFLW